MHDRTLQPGQRRNNQTTEPPTSHPEVTQPTAVSHPLWCLLDHAADNPHRGPVVSWKVESDDVYVELAATRWDELSKTGVLQHRGIPKLQLGLSNLAMETWDGHPIRGDVHLGVEDARLLITFLSRELDRIDHDGEGDMQVAEGTR